MEIPDLMMVFQLLRRYNPKVLLQKEQIATVSKPRYYGRNRPDFLSDRHLEVLRKNKMKNAGIIEAFGSFLKRGLELNVAKGLLGTDRFLQPENTNKLDKALEDVAGVFIMLLLNIQNRLIFLIHQQYQTLTAHQALTALVFFATSQEGAQETYIYLFKKIARESAELDIFQVILFLNYYPHQLILKYKNDSVLSELAPLLYDSSLRKVTLDVSKLNMKQFLSAFQGLVMLENRKSGELQPIIVNSFLTQFFLRLNPDSPKETKIADFDEALIFIEIYCKLLIPDGQEKVSSRLTNALDSTKFSSLVWSRLFSQKLQKCSLHELAAMLWVLEKLQAHKETFMLCEERFKEMLKEEAAKGLLPGTNDDYQDDIESTLGDLETIMLVLKKEEALSTQVERSAQESMSRLKVSHGGYNERKKWFYF